MGSDVFTSHLRQTPATLWGTNQTPSGQFGILQWCIFVDGQIYFGEENACGELPKFYNSVITEVSKKWGLE